MGSYTPKPDYGRRLLPTIVDDTARDDPDRAAFSVPRTDSDLSQGYIDVSYATFANAVDQLAWLIEVKLGRSENFEAMAYLGAPDIRYHCMQMAAIKTGYQVRSPCYKKQYLIFRRCYSALTPTVLPAT